MSAEPFDNETLTVSLALEGEVDLEVLSTALDAFTDLLAAVAEEERAEVAGWRLTGLRAGSAALWAAPYGPDPAALVRTVEAVNEVAEQISRGEWSSLPRRVQGPAKRLGGVAGGSVSRVVLGRPGGGSVLAEPPPRRAARPSTVASYGSVTGIISWVEDGPTPGFVLTDEKSGAVLRCSAPEDLAETVRALNEGRAVVSGRITRHSSTGRPKSLREIWRVEPAAPHMPGAFLRARGILKPAPDAEPVDAIVRRMRDAG